jgi:hypothetical protein
MLGSTTPTGDRLHGAGPGRGLGTTPWSPTFSGRFGRMFRNLPVYDVPDATLARLGLAMVQPLEDGKLDKPLGEADDDENTAQMEGALRLPAGYTYFGQFVDHDITFDPVSSLQRQNDPDALVDFRTPRFDLDSLYGRGPADQPYLYAADGIHLLEGESRSADPRFAGPDLPRASNGRALIGDPRNDENLIVSQLQVTFIKFHNAVIDLTRRAHPLWADDDILKDAQRTVRWHYQWVVINDFLARLVGRDVIEDILRAETYRTMEGDGATGAALTYKPRFYHWHEQPYMPVEFSVAAYRFGHSIVRPSYLINERARAQPIVDGASRIPLFSQTDEVFGSLNGFRPLPSEWGVQWQFFLPGIHGDAPAGAEFLPQPSYKLDAELSHPLGALHRAAAAPEMLVAGFDPKIAQDLAVRNLLRGKRLGLPGGQDVAMAMGIEPLSHDDLIGDLELSADDRAALEYRTPLWFYVLREAEVVADTAHLGPVGGRIVAEVLIGLLAGDPLSYLRVNPTWRPTLPAANRLQFTLTDLVNVALTAPSVGPASASGAGEARFERSSPAVATA